MIPTPTREQWASYSPHVRALLRARMTPEQLAEVAPRIGYSPIWGLPYPDDYNDPADSPNALQQLAVYTDAALSAAVQSVYDGYEDETDRLLAPDLPTYLVFPRTLPETPENRPALLHNISVGNVSGFEVLETGLYLVDVACYIKNPAIGKLDTFEIGMERYGSSAGIFSTATGNEQIAGASHEVNLHTTGVFYQGDTFVLFMRPLGATATDWTMARGRFTFAKLGA